MNFTADPAARQLQRGRLPKIGILAMQLRPSSITELGEHLW